MSLFRQIISRNRPSYCKAHYERVLDEIYIIAVTIDARQISEIFEFVKYPVDPGLAMLKVTFYREAVTLDYPGLNVILHNSKQFCPRLVCRNGTR